jgi:hypothetical protein
MDQQAKVAQARRNCAAARIRLQNAPLNSGAWLDAKASLAFWEARAAVYAAVDPFAPRRRQA